MGFKKLAIAAAVAAAPMSALALEPMQDEALSAVTGQDGIVVSINPTTGLSLDVYVHDTDGVAAGIQAGYANAGAIVIDNMSLTGQINLAIDAGDSVASGGGATTPVLNVNVGLPAGLTLATGDISVANSNRDGGTWGIEAGTQTGTIISSTSITLGAGTDLNIQLGSEPQGNMIALNTSITNGLIIGTSGDFTDNLSIADAGGSVTGGLLGASAVTIIDSGVGATALTLDVGVDVNATGLAIDLSGQGALDVRMEDVFMGTAAAANTIGDVEIVGLDLSNTTVTISGH